VCVRARVYVYIYIYIYRERERERERVNEWVSVCVRESRRRSLERMRSNFKSQYNRWDQISKASTTKFSKVTTMSSHCQVTIVLPLWLTRTGVPRTREFVGPLLLHVLCQVTIEHTFTLSCTIYRVYYRYKYPPPQVKSVLLQRVLHVSSSTSKECTAAEGTTCILLHK